jgi:hypothetical protein
MSWGLMEAFDRGLVAPVERLMQEPDATSWWAAALTASS